MKSNPKWKNQFHFIDVPKKVSPSYMVFSIILNPSFKKKKIKFINFVESKGLETRPIISGSFTNQPSSKLFKLNPKNKKFLGAEKVQKLGFVIGLHTKKIDKKKGILLQKLYLAIDHI